MDTTIHPSASLEIEGAVYEAALALDGAAREAFLEQFFRGDESGARADEAPAAEKRKILGVLPRGARAPGRPR